ncbi:dTDP-4-dehydrorhamnose 3,5-epimerase family protein [Erythrobacter sp. NFXS35]|uniref:dTDP-4-dehydrorhamnose 3,5-epimerase family protein n=1 Tax=Erythrobacter sp. NFXS35 TaxID=2818436 RepID=UPI0032DEBC5F
MAFWHSRSRRISFTSALPPYAPQGEHTLAWNDPTVAIEWPTTGNDPIISQKDVAGHSLANVPVFA